MNQSSSVREGPHSVSRPLTADITEESTANLSLRPPLSSYNRFVAFSIEYRLSYPEALKALLDKAGVDENGVIARNNPS